MNSMSRIAILVLFALLVATPFAQAKADASTECVFDAAQWGKAPTQRACEFMKNTPLWEGVSALYDPTKERIQERIYQIDLRLRKLKEWLRYAQLVPLLRLRIIEPVCQ